MALSEDHDLDEPGQDAPVAYTGRYEDEGAPPHPLTPSIFVLGVPDATQTIPLPRVSHHTDPRVFAFLDECCSKTYHPRQWKIEAEERGLLFSPVTGETKEYKGLGAASTLGRCKVRIGVECYPITNESISIIART